jgi:hypothetical protein
MGLMGNGTILDGETVLPVYGGNGMNGTATKGGDEGKVKGEKMETVKMEKQMGTGGNGEAKKGTESASNGEAKKETVQVTEDAKNERTVLALIHEGCNFIFN